MFICKVEISFRVLSLQVGFYVWKAIKDEVKTVPARDVLSKLQGWDESRGTAIVKVEYKVEAERHVITSLDTETKHQVEAERHVITSLDTETKHQVEAEHHVITNPET